MTGMLVSPSPVDETRFGMRTAKSFLSSADDLPEALRLCGDLQVEFLIARCPTSAIKLAQEMERQGFSLMDTLLYFSYDLVKGVPEDLSGNMLRMGNPGDGPALRDLARVCFKDYPGHYHADERLAGNSCDEVYADWAYQACISPDDGTRTIVAISHGTIAGFGTLHTYGMRCEGGVFGVAPPFRNNGIYRSIMIGCLAWCAGRGIDRMVISTQAANLASQKVWTRLGFEPSKSVYTFHKWFSPSERNTEVSR